MIEQYENEIKKLEKYLTTFAGNTSSVKMKKLMSCNLFTNGIYNNTIIKMFKKDFWKEFV